MTASFNPAAFSAILMGDESLTIACGDMLLAGGHEVRAVVTRDDAVRAWATEHEIDVADDPADLVQAAPSADWLLSVANLRMIPQSVINLAAKGAINFHDGPLPRYAGLNTPAWAIINAETRHGVSWHVIEGGVDEGDVLVQQEVEIAADETAFSLNSKCYAAGMESFAAVLAQLESGALDRTPQDLSQRSYYGRDQRPGGMGFLDFGKSANALCALVRGLDFGSYWNPLTTPKIAIGDHVLCVGKLAMSPDGAAPAGTVIKVAPDQITIGTSTTPVVLSQITDLDGGGVDLRSLVEIGAGLQMPVSPDLHVAGECQWRASLKAADALGLPLACAQVETGLARLPLAGTDFDPVTLAAAAALVALRTAGVSDGVCALGKEKTGATVTDWLPLHVQAEAERAFADFTADMASHIERAETSDGFARDLLLRDPDLSERNRPEIGLTLGGSAIDGCIATVALRPDGAALHYDRARLSASAAQMLAARLETAFAATRSAASCQDVWAMPAMEKTLLDSWNATKTPFDPVTIHAAFEAQANKTPDAQALVFEGESLSYAALNARANQVAHSLTAMGCATGTPVGLCVTRSLDLLVGALGILKAGGAYVPIDPAYPADRIAHYISDSAAPIIVTQDALVQGLPVHQAKVLCVDTDTDLKSAPAHNPDATAGAEDMAYLIYTSGSTGTPKGVMVTHGNVANFCTGMDDRIEHAQGAVWLAVTSLSFDISVLELFWTLARGLKVVLAGDESRTMVSNGPIAMSDRKVDFSLFYWGNDDGVGRKKYALLLDGARFADAHGFNAIWTPERHFHAFGGPYPNPSITGAAVAAVTQNLEVRAGSCVAPLHHPARIAEEWAVIDNLTEGRVGLAIASGWQPDDFVLRPENTPPENKPAMYDAIDQLRALWRGEPVSFPKQDGTLHPVVTQPRPVSRELPIWVTTAGNPQTWKEAGEIGAHVLTHLLGQSVDEVAGKIKIYHQALRDAGHDPADFKVTLMLHTYLADSRAAAEEVARGPMKDYLRSAAALIKQYAWAFPAFKRPAGTSNAFDLDLEGLSEDELDAILEFAFQRYFNDSGMFGTVADGLARTEQLKRIGVDEIACLIDYGIPSDMVLEGLKPLAEVLAGANETAQLAEDDFSLAAQIIRHDVTHLQCTPSMAQMLVTNDEARMALGRLEALMVGGEALPGPLCQTLKQATGARIQNMYGPTETTIWSTTHMVSDATAATAPIGTPIANTHIHVLDDAMNPLPVGVEGELWIGGEGVTQGYWRRPDVTAERYVPNPFGAGRLYRTGDLARLDADGIVHYAGRADAQVKIRGHRIELGEIEARLAELPGVVQAVVSTVETGGSLQLAGYVTSQRQIDPETARRALARVLPEIMVPSFIMTLEAMPLTPNKKIDRKALPRPERRPDRQGGIPEPKAQTDTHAAIATVWGNLLGVSDIRADDNFFALGGHSLLAVQAHRDLRAALGATNLTITDIFRFPILDALAAHLDKGQGTDPVETPVTPAPDAAKTMSKRRAMRAGRRKEGV